MTTAEAPAPEKTKRTRKTVDRAGFADAMSAVGDATEKPKVAVSDKPNPLMEAFQDSWNNRTTEQINRKEGDSVVKADVESGTPKELTIPTERENEARTLVIDAARRLGTGYRFRPENFTAEDGTPMTKVVFWAHEKSARSETKSA